MKTYFLWPLAGLLLVGCVSTRTITVSGPPPRASIAQVESMIQAHVSDAVIVNQIQNSSSNYNLTAEQIIALKNQGASDAVLNALISTASKPAPPAMTTTIDQAPLIYPYVYVDPWPLFWWGWGPYYHGGHYRGGGYRHWR